MERINNKVNKVNDNKKSNTKITKKVSKERPLTPKEKAFCREYIKSGSGMRAVYKAGYKCSNDNSASTRANELLRKPTIRAEIDQLQQKREDRAIATAQDVMEYFTKVMNGEIKDQFGLEAPLSERTKAASELAKRTIDIDNRIKGITEVDNTIHIKLDWNKGE